MLDPAWSQSSQSSALALASTLSTAFTTQANSIATVVSPARAHALQGVAWAASQFRRGFTFGTAVAETIGSGLIDVNQVDNLVIFSGLVGAITWDLITWRIGLPVSSSHALIGGYAGAAHRQGGLRRPHRERLVKTLSFIVIARRLDLCWARCS